MIKKLMIILHLLMAQIVTVLFFAGCGLPTCQQQVNNDVRGCNPTGFFCYQCLPGNPDLYQKLQYNASTGYTWCVDPVTGMRPDVNVNGIPPGQPPPKCE